MSAAELRQAAETLRGKAGAARPDRGCWIVQQNLPEHRDYDAQAQVMTDPKGPLYQFVASSVFIDDANYIATMHPGVGLALAEWLEDCAETEEFSGGLRDTIPPPALDVARLINGGAA